MKTNQSYVKRLKITRRGKILARPAGQDHFNAKARRVRQLAAKRLRTFRLKRQAAGRFLPNLV